MPIIKFVQHDGTEQDVEVAIGESIMQAAVNNQIPNILADCGGACACGTCHAYINSPWREQIAPADELEVAMLEVALHVKDTSRLSCQIKITKELDGLVVNLPESQI
jgi:2Fe-2S ferredoxin